MSTPPRPYTLVAELTYACPLKCVYCSNPVDHRDGKEQLSTAEWRRLLKSAAGLGVLQVHFTGGEPLLRDDLEELIATARSLGIYTNLITSGVPLEFQRLRDLEAAGLDALQLSVQDVAPEVAREIAGGDFLEQKLRVADWVKQVDLPLTMNVVLHRSNVTAARTPSLREHGRSRGSRVHVGHRRDLEEASGELARERTDRRGVQRRATLVAEDVALVVIATRK